MTCVRCGKSFPSKYYYPEQLVVRGVLLCRRCFDDLGTPSLPEVLKAYPAPPLDGVPGEVQAPPTRPGIKRVGCFGILALLAALPGLLLFLVECLVKITPEVDGIVEVLRGVWVIVVVTIEIHIPAALLLAIGALFERSSVKSKLVVWACIGLSWIGLLMANTHARILALW